MIIKNSRNKKILADQAVLANTFLKRLRGLMYRKELKEGEGLFLSPCNSIHTFGMRFNIDVVFISKGGEVIKTVENLKANKMTTMVLKAAYVLELPVGIIKDSNTEIGDVLDLIY